jgi:hypothetical protein
MPVIVLRTRVAAPPRRCFDLARDVDLHERSTAASRERAVAGVTSGRLADGFFLRRYMIRLLRARNAYLKRAAESAPPG